MTCTLDKFFIGGSLSGLAPGESVGLENNGVDSLALSGNGNFTFSAPLADNSSYSVTVASQPAGQTCTITNGIGTLAGSDITTASVTCADNSSPPDSGTPKPVPVMPAWLLGLMLALMTGFGFIGIKRDR